MGRAPEGADQRFAEVATAACDQDSHARPNPNLFRRRRPCFPHRRPAPGQRLSPYRGRRLMRRTLAALGTGGIFAVVLIGSRAQPGAESPPPAKLPAAIGAIQPRLSPDGASVAFSYQGGIWVVPRTGGTMTLLSTGEGEDTEPAWSPDGKRIAFVRGAAVKLIEAASGNDVPL